MGARESEMCGSQKSKVVLELVRRYLIETKISKGEYAKYLFPLSFSCSSIGLYIHIYLVSGAKKRELREWFSLLLSIGKRQQLCSRFSSSFNICIHCLGLALLLLESVYRNRRLVKILLKRYITSW